MKKIIKDYGVDIIMHSIGIGSIYFAILVWTTFINDLMLWNVDPNMGAFRWFFTIAVLNIPSYIGTSYVGGMILVIINWIKEKRQEDAA